MKHWSEYTLEQKEHILTIVIELLNEPETCPNCGETGGGHNLPFRFWHEDETRETYVCWNCGWFETLEKG